MEIKFGSDEPEFFNLDKEIQRLLDEHKNAPTELSAFKQEMFNKINQINQQISAKTIEFNTKQSERLNQLAKLREAKKREDESAIFEKTAKLVHEIVQDFPTWTMAREYQAEDVIAIVHQFIIGEAGVLNANEMALGKTFESIVALYIIIELFERETGRKPTVLWLTKSSILETDSTIKEINRWWPEFRIAPLKGSSKPDMREFVLDLAKDGSMAILTNYETMRTTEAASKITWDIVIMDEVHKLKGGANANGPTAIWEAVKNCTQDSRFIMMLSGTPMVNKPEEMWSYLHIFDPVIYPSAKDFRRQFGAIRSIAGQLTFTIDAEKLLRQALKGRMIRRTAHEVGLQLPPVTYQDIVLPHNPEQAKIYKQMVERFFVWLDEQTAVTAASILAQTTRLRQINVLPVCNFYEKDEDGNIINTIRLDVNDSSKLDDCVDRIFGINDQVVVFSNFNEPLRELCKRVRELGYRAEMITSEYSKEMKYYETDFQAGKIDVLCINSAMGEGLNLQKSPDKWEGGARAGITLDRWWNPARNDQCVKRIVRPGNDEPVFIYHYYVENSIDYYIADLVENKRKEFDSVMEDDTIRSASDWKSYLQGKI